MQVQLYCYHDWQKMPEKLTGTQPILQYLYYLFNQILILSDHKAMKNKTQSFVLMSNNNKKTHTKN